MKQFAQIRAHGHAWTEPRRFSSLTRYGTLPITSTRTDWSSSMNRTVTVEAATSSSIIGVLIRTGLIPCTTMGSTSEINKTGLKNPLGMPGLPPRKFYAGQAKSTAALAAICSSSEI